MMMTRFKITFLLAILFLGSTNDVLAQPAIRHEFNFGLKQPLADSLLPKSLAKVQWPVRVAKKALSTILEPAGSNAWLIKNSWELIEASTVTGKNIFSDDYNTGAWYNATVPGTVLTTLVDQGVYPDPYFGLNNLAIPDTLSRIQWWYRTPFTIPANNTGKKVWLLFNGINYKAEVWLNGERLGNINGAFARGEFDATKLIKSGTNVLAVKILPPPNPGIPHEQSPRSGMGPNGGQLALDGPTFISSEGWDWVPGIRDRNIGLWQDVELRLTGDVTLTDPQVITDLPLPDTSRAAITIKTTVKNTSAAMQLVTINGTIENITVKKQLSVPANSSLAVVLDSKEFPQLLMNRPRLWWPNGYGPQELYDLKLTVQQNNGPSDEAVVRFGVRELSYDLSVDFPDEPSKRIEFDPLVGYRDQKPLFDNVHKREVRHQVYIPKLLPGVDVSLFKNAADTAVAPYLVIRVNGQRIFCKGGNWGMDDAMKRVSRERLEPYFKLHKNANYTMIRNWTGESTEKIFYDLCDEYGMLVWNDFWLSTETYNLEALDETLFVNNVAEVIKRFRNHPSIAIWCPRNEGYAPKGMENSFGEIIAKEDGTRHYIGNSREINLKQSGPWSFYRDPAYYFKEAAEGFTTEIGTLSVPTATTIRKFMAKEDQWPIGDVWYYHDFHLPHFSDTLVQSVDEWYGKATGLDDFSKKVQLINYNNHRAIFEAWNSRLWNNTSGVLLWMSHPAWPSTTWQTYSYDYDTHGSYYGAKKGCEPLHIQLNLHNNKLVVINTTLQSLPAATATLALYDLQGKLLFSQHKKADIAANNITEILQAVLPETLPANYLLRLTLKGNNGKLYSENDYLKTTTGDFLALNKLSTIVPGIHIINNKNKAAGQLLFDLKNPAKEMAVGIKLRLVNKKTNQEILPAYFSDGYINLLPGEVRRMTVDYDRSITDPLEIITEGYN